MVFRLFLHSLVIRLADRVGSHFPRQIRLRSIPFPYRVYSRPPILSRYE